MTDFRRLAWRYKAGNCLREEVRDRFNEELDRMRARNRELSRDMGVAVTRGANVERVARELDELLMDTEDHVRAARFDEALRTMRSATTRLETLEESWLALRQIERTERQVLELEELLSKRPFATILDFHILLIRSREFFEREKYRMARVLATVCAQNLERLTVAVPGEDPLPQDVAVRIERQSAIARTLDRLSVQDAARTRSAVSAIERARARRYFELARALARDLETENAPIETFLAQAQGIAGEDGVDARARQWLGTPTAGGFMDWRGAAARMAAESLADSARRMAQRALTAQQGT
jgi:hypothetical protein